MKLYLMMQIPPPSTMLTAVKIPSIDSIQFHRIQSFTTHSEQQHPKFATSQVPVYMQVDHIRSNFVYVSLLVDIIYTVFSNINFAIVTFQVSAN